jgi:23S rRNA (adenine2503-C2)-methyltransferase
VDRRPSFFDFTRAELASWFEEEGQPGYRADQLYRNCYQRGITDPGAMTDLPTALRRELEERLDFDPLRETQRLASPDGGATKFLWRLADGKEIEGVLMHADYGQTICFSTQVGCAFRCTFCVTGRMGRIRQLTAGEIVAQVYTINRRRPGEERGANLVAMGMGEPMDNLDALLRAIAILRDDRGMNISARRITVSTVGVVPGIERLARENPSVSLAVSLNATTNEVRRELMPVTRKYPIEALMSAVENFARASKRRVTLEYVLIKGLNDTPDDADRLGRMAERFPSKLNVIPFNPSDLFTYRRPSAKTVDAFARRLWRYRTTVTVRYSKGLDILAACGQLGYGQVKEQKSAEA